MKNKSIILFSLFFVSLFHCSIIYAQTGNIGIGTTSPDSSAILDIQSTNKGVLIPRMSTTQVSTISSPEKGLMVFDTTKNTFVYYNGIKWKNFNQSSIIEDTDGDTRVDVEVGGIDFDEIIFFLDTFEYFKFSKGNIEFESNGNTISIGNNAGASDDRSTNNNINIGDQAGRDNTIGQYNVAIGTAALRDNKDDQNVAVGEYSMQYHKTGKWNTSIGSSSLLTDTSGVSNTAIGSRSLWNNKNGINNTAIGDLSLSGNTIGYSNTAIGSTSNAYNKTGHDNVTIGYQSNVLDTIGNFNIIIGSNANHENQAGHKNTIVGTNAGYGPSAHSKSGVVFLGYQAGYSETTDNKLYIENSNSTTPLIYGDFDSDTVKIYGTLGIKDEYIFPSTDGVTGQILANDGNGKLLWTSTTAVNALNDLTDVKTDYASLNMIAGNGGLNLLPTANRNTGFGDDALRDVTSGSRNNAFGSSALYLDSTGIQNNAFGSHALAENLSGSYNVAFGESALFKNTNGNYNVGIGKNANYYNGTGSKNTSIGHEAGHGIFNTNKSGSVSIGYQAGYSETSSNKLYIENSASTTPLIWGDFANDTIKIYGTLGIKDAYVLPITDGTLGQLLSTNGNGQTSWETNNNVSKLNDLSDAKSDNDGSDNGSSIFIGLGAGFSDDQTDNKNVGVGQGALQNNTNGSNNIAVGYLALSSNIGGSFNTALGLQSLSTNQSGEDNTAAGFNSLNFNLIGNNNTALGNGALHYNNAHNNVGVGKYSNFWNESGSNNTIIGYEAGHGPGPSVHNKSGSVFVGYQAGYSEVTNDKLYIENSGSSVPLIYGDFANDHLNINGKQGIGIGNGAPSHQLAIKSNDSLTIRLIGHLGSFDHGARINFGDAQRVYIDEPTDDEMRIHADRVGLRRIPVTNELELEGDASKTTAGNWTANSDRRIKTDIRKIKNSLTTLQQLKPVKFKYTAEWKLKHPSIKDQYYYNFIAQEYAEVFPESVKPSGEFLQGDPKEILQIDTYNAQILSIQAIKDLITENNDLKQRLSKLEQQMDVLLGMVSHNNSNSK